MPIVRGIARTDHFRANLRDRLLHTHVIEHLVIETLHAGLVLHALICGSSTMCLSVGTPAARKKARGVLREVVEMLVAKHAARTAKARKQAPRSRKPAARR